MAGKRVDSNCDCTSNLTRRSVSVELGEPRSSNCATVRNVVIINCEENNRKARNRRALVRQRSADIASWTLVSPCYWQSRRRNVFRGGDITRRPNTHQSGAHEPASPTQLAGPWFIRGLALCACYLLPASVYLSLSVFSYLFCFFLPIFPCCFVISRPPLAAAQRRRASQWRRRNRPEKVQTPPYRIRRRRMTLPRARYHPKSKKKN